MDKYHLHWYTDEIQMHAASALASYELLCKLLASRDTRQGRNVWFALVSFFTHVGMVSKFLYPIKSKERGAELRSYLNLTNDSVILSRAARDNLEHFDERIDAWVERNLRGVLEMVFQSRSEMEFLGAGPWAIRRVLIVDELVFLSEDRKGDLIETPLIPIHKAIYKLNATCLRKLATDSPYAYKLASVLLAHKS